MFCSNCGKTLNANLNYCSSCGTRVEAEKPVILRSGSSVLSVGAIVMGLVGLLGFFPLLDELRHSGIEIPAVVMILFAYLLTVLVMFSVLVWQSRKGTTEVRQKRGPHRDAASPELRPVNTAQLHEGMPQPASVTENTTRTLDQIPFRER